jgi:hypothetical protein
VRNAHKDLTARTDVFRGHISSYVRDALSSLMSSEIGSEKVTSRWGPDMVCHVLK